MALGLTQPLTENTTRNIPGGIGGRCAGLKIMQLSCADCLKSGSLKLLEPSGPDKACNGIALPLPLPFGLIETDIFCNENQLHTLFILNLFGQKPLHVSGVVILHYQEVFTVYVQQLVRVIRLS
jgi:hypothetical protein